MSPLMQGVFYAKCSPPVPPQVNLALAVIYGRHLLAALLADWPDGHRITSAGLDNCDEVQLIGILDILQRLEKRELLKKVFLLILTHIFLQTKPKRVTIQVKALHECISTVLSVL